MPFDDGMGYSICMACIGMCMAFDDGMRKAYACQLEKPVHGMCKWHVQMACGMACAYLRKVLLGVQCLCMSIPARVHTCACLYLRMPISAHAYTCACLYLRMPIPAHAYTHACLYCLY